MKPLIGTHECKADVKGRIMMPSSLKKQLSGVLQDGFVLKRAVFQNCLELYPITEWNDLIEKVNSLNRFKKKNNDFIRRFTAGVRLLELDTSGRFLIPKDLIEFALHHFHSDVHYFHHLCLQRTPESEVEVIIGGHKQRRVRIMLTLTVGLSRLESEVH